MSDYTTDEILELLNKWIAEHQRDSDFDKVMPLKGFDWLLGANLQGIDLSSETIQAKAEEWRESNGVDDWPLWYRDGGGINLLRSIISKNADDMRTDLSYAQLEGADLSYAELQGATLISANLNRAVLIEAQLQHTMLQFSELKGAHLQRARLHGAFLFNANVEDAHLYGIDWNGDYRLGGRQANTERV